MPDGAVFCSQCGTRTDSSEPESNSAKYENNVNQDSYYSGENRSYYADNYSNQPEYGYYDAGAAAAVQVKTQKKNKLIGIIAVAAVVVIAAVVVLLIVLGGGKGGAKSPEDAIARCIEVIESGDGKDLLDIMPESMVDAAMEQGYFSSRSDVEAYLTTMLNSARSSLEGEYGKNTEITFSINSMRAYGADEVAYFNASNEYGIVAEAVQEVDVDMILNHDGGQEIDNVVMTVVQVDGSWYIIEPF